MDFLQYPLALIVTLGVLVTVHEFGHFIIARWSGVSVVRFSVGFGKPLFTWIDKHGTEFVLAMIPLGGYVRMLDEREWEAFASKPPQKISANSYQSLSVYWRIAIALGGPLANFVLAILIYWLLATVGTIGLVPVLADLPADSPAALAGMRSGEEIVAIDGITTESWPQVALALAARMGDSGQLDITTRYPSPNPASQREHTVGIEINDWHRGEESPDLGGSLGIQAATTVLGDILAGSPAERAGLKSGDRIIEVDNQSVGTWSEWVAIVRDSPNQTLAIRVNRAGDERDLSITPGLEIASDGTEYGLVGVMLYVRETQYTGLGALQQGFRETWSKTVLTLNLLKKMVTGLVSTRNLSGPITIAKVAGDYAKSGWIAFTGLLALLSISLGVLNLLPIPVLDGGHILFCLLEILRGKPLSERVQNIGLQLGIFIVSGMMLLAFFNDISRLM
ncbi:MAG: RIP metalloprotease RseP [Pseudomonadales bacterium]|nr:RIP metalloprotease RseP [Pseudomonadales bacterium]